jgi:polysaccharide export outer membrane protein
VTFARLAVVAAALGMSGCAIAPGIKMDEGAAEARGRATTKDRNFRVEPVSPATVQRLVSEAPPPAAKDPLADLAKTYTYRVAPYDILNVIVWEHPELTIPAGEFRTAEATGNTVGADGTMFYPYAGTVKVGGKTLPEIRALLTEQLSRVIRNPQLDVRIASFRGQKVNVTGEVVAPGAVPITDVPLRLQDAISAVRGLTPEADPTDVTLGREGRVYRLDLQAFYERGDASQNWLLKDGDVVTVGDRRFNRVFVLGEVRQPAARPMVRRKLSLADALGDSNWLDPITANPARIYVIRGDYSAPQIFKLNAESPDALLLATAFPLKPRDVVFVSTYEVSRFNRVISQILPSVALLYQIIDLPNRADASFNVIGGGEPR